MIVLRVLAHSERAGDDGVGHRAGRVDGERQDEAARPGLGLEPTFGQGEGGRRVRYGRARGTRSGSGLIAKLGGGHGARKLTRLGRGAAIRGGPERRGSLQNEATKCLSWLSKSPGNANVGSRRLEGRACTGVRKGVH